ncbi:unnamed protein product, partial [Ectocarpus sp. 12 AP-2014]
MSKIHDAADGSTFSKSSWRQFCVLLRKNFLVTRRTPFSLLIELAVPALFLYLMGLIKGDSEPTRYE